MKWPAVVAVAVFFTLQCPTVEQQSWSTYRTLWASWARSSWLSQVQLTNDVLGPRRVLPLTGPAAFQVLRAHEVPAVDVEHTTHGLIEPSAGQLTPAVGARKPVGPHPVGRPEEEPALEEGVGRGHLRIEEPGSRRGLPEAQPAGEDSLLARDAGEQSPA